MTTVDAILLSASLILTALFVRYSLHYALLLFKVRHKSLYIFSAFYSIVVFVAFLTILFALPQPKVFLNNTISLLSDAIVTLSDRLKESWSKRVVVTSTPERSTPNNEPTPSLKEPTPIPAATSTVIVPDIFCFAAPGQEYTAIYLRDTPSYLKEPSKKEFAKRGTKLKVIGKVSNKEGTWFVVKIEDGHNRYVNSATCSTDTNLHDIPEIP